MKPHTQNSEDVTKYHPVSLLNIGGKILEKGFDNQNKSPHEHNGVLKQESVQIYSTNEHNRRGYGLKRIRPGRIFNVISL